MQYFIDWLITGFDTPKNIIAQIFGIIPLFLSFIMFLQKTRARIIIVKVIADLLFTLHFILLEEYVGAFLNVVCVVRSIVFLFRDKKFLNNVFVPIFFCILTLLCSFADFEGIKSLMPAVGSVIAIIGFWQNDLKKLRWYSFFGFLLWVIYGIWTVSISTIIANGAAAISIIIKTLFPGKKEE